VSQLAPVREAMERGDWVAARRGLVGVDRASLSDEEREEALRMELELGVDPLAWAMLLVGLMGLLAIGWTIL